MQSQQLATEEGREIERKMNAFKGLELEPMALLYLEYARCKKTSSGEQHQCSTNNVNNASRRVSSLERIKICNLLRSNTAAAAATTVASNASIPSISSTIIPRKRKHQPKENEDEQPKEKQQSEEQEDTIPMTDDGYEADSVASTCSSDSSPCDSETDSYLDSYSNSLDLSTCTNINTMIDTIIPINMIATPPCSPEKVRTSRTDTHTSTRSALRAQLECILQHDIKNGLESNHDLAAASQTYQNLSHRGDVELDYGESLQSFHSLTSYEAMFMQSDSSVEGGNAYLQKKSSSSLASISSIGSDIALPRRKTVSWGEVQFVRFTGTGRRYSYKSAIVS